MPHANENESSRGKGSKGKESVRLFKEKREYGAFYLGGEVGERQPAAHCVHVIRPKPVHACHAFYSTISWSRRGLEVIAHLVPLSLSSSTTQHTIFLRGGGGRANWFFAQGKKPLSSFLSISKPFFFFHHPPLLPPSLSLMSPCSVYSPVQGITAQ